MRRLIYLGLLVVLIAPGPGRATDATPTSAAAQFVQSLGDQALHLLSETEKPLTEREAAFRELMRENIDLDTIGRFVIGKEWRAASPEQREEYQTLFGIWTVQTYSRLMFSYEGGSFRIESARPAGQRDILVTTDVRQPSGQSVKAGWRLRRQEDGFKIIDVLVEGVSMAATQRSEFDALIRRQGLTGLIETLRAKVSSFSAKAS